MQLAVQAGTPNDQLVERAKEIHRFITEEDPLRLDVPSPKEPDNAKEVKVPIDWDRPQLVTLKSTGMVVQTDGRHTTNGFNGTIVVAGRFRPKGEYVGDLPKRAYEYYGEIPQEQKGEIDWSIPMVVVSKNDGLTIRTDGFHKGGSFSGTVIGGNPNRAYNNDGHYSQAWNKEYFEPKTTGLDFLQAIKAAKRGKNIRRARNWSNGYFWHHSNDTMYDSDGDRIDSMNPSNILATDWEIVQ